MRRIIILGLLFLVLWVLYSLNIQYGWVELQMNWTKVAIGIAAAGGPLQYLQKRIEEKKQDAASKTHEYRTMKHEDYQEIKNRNSNPQ